MTLTPEQRAIALGMLANEFPSRHGYPINGFFRHFAQVAAECSAFLLSQGIDDQARDHAAVYMHLYIRSQRFRRYQREARLRRELARQAKESS